MCWKQGGKVVRTEHIGSANSDVALAKLLEEAREIMRGKEQKTLFNMDKIKDHKNFV